MDDLVTCCACNRTEVVEEAVECDGELYCATCARLQLRRCICCDEVYNTNDENCWGGMCSSCCEEHFICEGCHEVYHVDDYGGNGVCVHCYEGEEEEEETPDHVREYHHPPAYVFHPEGEKLYFGVELETDDYGNRSRAAEDLHKLSENESLFFMEEDGSLSQGIEIISQPCSLDYHKHSFPWKEVTGIVALHGGQSHNTGTCGLHIHFSRETFNGKKEKLYQIRLVYFFEKFWTEMVVFSRRTGSWRHNADRYNIPIYDKPASEKLGDIKRSFYRYQAVNLVNLNTIEIRIFRGSLKVSTLLASLELVDFLIHLVKKTSNVELQAMSWAEVVERAKTSKYEYLYPYLKDIGLVEGGQNVLDSCET